MRREGKRGDQAGIDRVQSPDELRPDRLDIPGRGDRERADEPPAMRETADEGGRRGRRAEVDGKKGARVAHPAMLPGPRRLTRRR